MTPYSDWAVHPSARSLAQYQTLQAGVASHEFPRPCTSSTDRPRLQGARLHASAMMAATAERGGRQPYTVVLLLPRAPNTAPSPVVSPSEPPLHCELVIPLLLQARSRPAAWLAQPG